MNFQYQLNQAFHRFEEGNLQEADRIYRALFAEALSPEQEIRIRFNYGFLLSEQSRFDEALVNYQRALELAKNLGDKDLISQSHHQIGMVYRVAKYYDDALVAFQKERAYINMHFSDHSLYLAANEYEMGYTKLLNEDLKSAKDYLDTSLSHALAAEDDVMIACSYRGLGDYYKEVEQLNRARDMYNKSIQYFEHANDGLGVQEVEEKLNIL